MGSKWRLAKLALGLHRCVYTSPTLDEPSPPSSNDGLSQVLLLSPRSSESKQPPPTPPSRLSRKGSKSSKQTCAICLAEMKQGGGHAIFTAECNHSFHFHCITSNVKHGNQICPVCRAKWKEVPLQAPSLDAVPRNAVDWHQADALMTVVRRLPTRRELSRRQNGSLQVPEPAVFDDDESLDLRPPVSDRSRSAELGAATIQMQTHTEVSAVDRSTSVESFTILVNLRAAFPTSPQGCHARAPVDIVTVLDISGSMAGTKLALLKRAMGFVIQNLGSNDRLSVIAFSSTACRLFPLRRMNDSGRQQALLAVNALVAGGGTNIVEGLKRGAKVMEERKEKNNVASIILLSDGQDTYTLNSQPQQSYHHHLPSFVGLHIPVHAFGFGADHDAVSMHSISQISGGTFSFIENEAVLQDAFAQCIGGLLSVVAQELQVRVECVNPSSAIGVLKAGSYSCKITENSRNGYVDIGDLYADEERDILVCVNVPVEPSANHTSLLKVTCVYKDHMGHEISNTEEKRVVLERPEASTAEAVVSVEVDRQRNRLHAAEAMTRARAAAERGDLSVAVSILEKCRKTLSETVSGKSNDRLCVALDAELKEMQERLGSRPVYEASGRAYILSGLSSHSWQRATARGDSTEGSSLVQAYQTPSMTEMLTRSQSMLPKPR